METGEIVAIVAILLIIGGALAYIIRAKKSGKKCIGCPESDSCHASGCGGCGHCHADKDESTDSEEK